MPRPRNSNKFRNPPPAAVSRHPPLWHSPRIPDTKSWWDKFTLWFRRTGYRLAEYAELLRLGILVVAIPLLPTVLSIALAGYMLLSTLGWGRLAFTNKEDTVAVVSD